MLGMHPRHFRNAEKIEVMPETHLCHFLKHRKTGIDAWNASASLPKRKVAGKGTPALLRPVGAPMGPAVPVNCKMVATSHPQGRN